MESKTTLLLVGCGKMGAALLQRILSAQLASSICVVEPASPPDHLKIPASLKWLSSHEKIDVGFTPDIVILAIKPQSMADVAPHYARFKTGVFLSIAAGVTISQFQKWFGEKQAVIRAMPNLPASIGKGISVAVASKTVSAGQRALADRFLKTVGETAWVEDEKLIDAVTALSGSGPAYVFALCEAMTKAGESLGLPADLATRLARATVIGSGALLEQSPETAEALRRAVTSPGGTTETALKHLLASGGLPDVMREAIRAAADRAKELANSSGK